MLEVSEADINLVCDVGCTQCADLTAECTSCKTGFTQDPTDKTKCDPLPQATSSGSPCPDGSFSNNGVCALCSSVCQTCTGPSPNDCVLCASGQFLFNGNCVSVNTNGICQGTNGMIADNIKHECDCKSKNTNFHEHYKSNPFILACGASCTACKYPTFSAASILSDVQCTGCLPGFVLSNGTCLASCPSGTFVSPQDNLTCIGMSIFFSSPTYFLDLTLSFRSLLLIMF
jgi:hypothetical protein